MVRETAVGQIATCAIVGQVSSSAPLLLLFFAVQACDGEAARRHSQRCATCSECAARSLPSSFTSRASLTLNHELTKGLVETVKEMIADHRRKVKEGIDFPDTCQSLNLRC